MMTVILELQARLFFVGMGYGAFLMLVYQMIVIVRNILKLNLVWVNIIDLLFWLYSAGTVISMIYTYDNGNLRSYDLLGLGVGVLVSKILIVDPVKLMISRYKLKKKLKNK